MEGYKDLALVHCSSFLSIHQPQSISFLSPVTYPYPSSIRKMPLLVSALSALVIVSSALATPVRRANQTFTIYEDVPKPFVPSPVRMLKTYQKYGVTPPPDVLATAADGSVTATPILDDAEYLCSVTIGGQLLNLDLDTGSADL
jgi:hypothetical protein